MKDHHSFLAATTDVIIVCRWRAPSVGHGSRLKVVACFCFDTFLRSMHIDESTIQNIEQYLESRGRGLAALSVGFRYNIICLA